MKLARKSLLVLAGLSCAVSMVMTGCEGSSKAADNQREVESKSDTNDKDTEKKDTDTDKKTELEPVTIKWYQAGATEPEDLKKVVDAANKYIADKTDLNCTLELHMFDFGSYPDTINRMIATGDKFDICFTAGWCGTYAAQVSKKSFLPLNDEKQLLHTYAPKTEALLGEDFLKGSQINGINYAIPANKEKAHQWGLLLRSDIVDKYKMDITKIKKLEDLEPLLQQVKEGEGGNMFPFEAISGESPFRVLDFDRIGGDDYPGVVYNDDASTVFNELEKPETEALFKLMNKYYKAGYIRQDANAITDYTVDQKAGKIFAAVRSLKPGKDSEEGMAMNQKYVQVGLTTPVISNRETTGSMQAISYTSENPERALMLLELFNTDPEFNNLINFGIEGEHFTRKDNIISKTDKTDKYSLGLGWAFGNQFINYIWDNEDPEKWKKFEEFNAEATPTQTLGFIYDPTDVQTEVAQCGSLWKQYIPGLETGISDPETKLPEAIEAFKTAGSDAIIKDKQAKLDEWKATVGK